MQSPRCSHYFNSDDEKSLLEQIDDGGEHIGTDLPDINATSDIKWGWLAEDAEVAKEWKETTKYQQFYEHWRDPSVVSHFLNAFPYNLALGGDPLSLQPSRGIGEDPIVITKSSDIMFHRLLCLRHQDLGTERGAVITGQPGAGKTTFLRFMLVQLIFARQVILVCYGATAYLFCCGRVYRRPMNNVVFEYLPRHKTMGYCPIWLLIDVDYKEAWPPIEPTSNVWPIQTSSPCPIQWRAWRKQYNASMMGMPQWSMEELMAGLYLQPDYNMFHSKLELLLLGGSMPPGADVNLAAVAEVLKREKENRDEKGDDMDDEVDDDMGINKAGEPRVPVGVGDVHTALKILVRNATEEFGFAPRDVYMGVFKLKTARVDHNLRQLDYPKLLALIKMFLTSHAFDEFSHRVVAVYPDPSTSDLERDLWVINFKSTQIARRVMEMMRSEEDQHLRNMFRLLHPVPEGSAMAGWFFEAIVHRLLSNGWRSDRPAPQAITMASDGGDPPIFTTDLRSVPAHHLTPVRADGTTRTTTRVDFTDGLSNVTLDNNRYYIPTASNNPLFDSFTVDVDNSTIIISIFQITTSKNNGGSAQGYLRIRKIMAHLRKLRVRRSYVKVAYLLVCPADGLQHRWEMPVSWNKNWGHHDHRGEAFCVSVPVLSP